MIDPTKKRTVEHNTDHYPDLAQSQEAFLLEYSEHFKSVHASSRTRRVLHGVFVAAHSVVFGGLTLSGQSGTPLLGAERHFIIFTTIAGIVISLIWWAIANFYRERTREDVAILSELEERMPIQFFKLQWQRLMGTKWRFAPPVDHVLPLSFVVLHAALLIGILTGTFMLGV